MAEKINLNDLFDFSNLKSLKEFEKRLESIANTLEELQKNGRTLSSALGKSLEEIAKDAEEVEKAVKKTVDPKEIAKQEKAVDRLSESFDKQTARLKELEAQNKRLEEALKATNKERQNSKKKLTEQEKLQNKLQGVIRGETQEVQRLRVALAEANKESKQAARESLGLVSAYEKESKRLNELRKRYKDLAVQKGIDAEETQKLGREVAKLDQELKDIDKSVGQFQREVGNYENATKDAAKATDGLGKKIDQLDNTLKVSAGIGILITAISKLGEVFTSTGEGSESLRIALAKLSAVLTVGGRALGQFITSLVSDLPSALSQLTGSLVAGFTNAFATIQNNFQNLLLGLVTPAQIRRQIQQGFTGVQQGAQGITNAFNNASGAFDGLGDKVQEQIDLNTKLAESEIRLEKTTRTLEQRIATEAAAYEELTQKADNSTISLEKRLEFAEKAGKAGLILAESELELAQKNLNLANKRIKAEEAQGQATVESLDAQSAAIIAVTDARANAERQETENRIQQAELRSDLIEQNLDLLIDAADFEKAVNERRLADERLSLEERAKILKETEKLQRESVVAQVAELQKATTSTLDIQELQKTLTEEGAEAFTEQAKALGLSEVLALRLLEVVKENAVATQDLAEANKDLRDQGFDKDLIEEEIKLQEERLKKIKEIKGDETELIEEQREAEEKLLQLQIDALQREIEERKKAGEVVLEEQKELNDLLLQQQEARINKELENEQKAADQRTEIFNSPIAEGLIDGIAARQTKQAEILEKQAELTEDEAEKQELLAKAAKEREKAELRILFIETLKSGLQAGKSPTEATQEAILVTAGAKIAADVAGFHDGGYTGDGGEWTEAGVVHKGEMVQTKKQVGIYGMKGWSAADFDSAVQSGYFRKFEVSDQLLKGGDVAPAQLIDYDKLADKIGGKVAASIPQTSYKWIEEGLLRTEKKGLSSASYKIKRKSKSL